MSLALECQQFIFALVRADSPKELVERIGLVTDLSYEHKAVVHNVIGPLIVMALGTLTRATESSGTRQELVRHLQRQFGADIKIVHGSVDGHFGAFGSARYLAFTFTFPHFDHALAALGRVEFGSVEEFVP